MEHTELRARVEPISTAYALASPTAPLRHDPRSPPVPGAQRPRRGVEPVLRGRRPVADLRRHPHHQYRPRLRSEERRVGKECRCRWWADHAKKKKQTTNRHVKEIGSITRSRSDRERPDA